jgi:hypothetical protein
MMGKHVEVKRVALNALVHPETLAVIRADAKRLGVSQGALIDAAFAGTGARTGIPITVNRSLIQPSELTVEYE